MLLLTPLVLTSGCATHALWTKSALDNWNEPAQENNLRLFDGRSQKDFLIVYDEHRDRHDDTRTRAYFLYQNLDRVGQNRAPHFVSTNLACGLSPVPVFRSPSCCGTNRSAGPFAVTGINAHSFTLYFRDGGSESYQLPVYSDGTGKYKRAALTPLAVTADLTVVGGFVGIFCWACLAGDNFSLPYSCPNP
jgi:hypothetical protein